MGADGLALWPRRAFAAAALELSEHVGIADGLGIDVTDAGRSHDAMLPKPSAGCHFITPYRINAELSTFFTSQNRQRLQSRARLLCCRPSRPRPSAARAGGEP